MLSNRVLAIVSTSAAGLCGQARSLPDPAIARNVTEAAKAFNYRLKYLGRRT
jgi:hypothetical protein